MQPVPGSFSHVIQLTCSRFPLHSTYHLLCHVLWNN
nr:MAG TPA: hypothetical protein [Caudoviricetes sp.]